MPRSVSVLEVDIVDLLEDETVGLCTGYTVDGSGDITVSGEPSGNAYATVLVEVADWDGPARVGADQAVTVANTGAITFPAPSGAWSGGAALSYVVIRRDSDSEIKDVIPLDPPVVVTGAGAAPSIPAGWLTITLEG